MSQFGRTPFMGFIVALAFAGCSSGGNSDAEGGKGGSAEGGSGGAGGSGGKSGSSGGGSSGGNAAGSGGGVVAGSAGSAAGATAGSGGSAGGSAGAVAGMGGSAAGMVGSAAGTGGGMTSAICPAGMTYGNPLPANTTPKKLKDTGFEGVEGPVWVASASAFFFSDLQRKSNTNWAMASSAKIWKYTPANEMFEPFITAAGSNGLAVTNDGKILAATHSNGGLTLYDPADKTKSEVWLTGLNNQPFGSPNDLAVRADGNVYFSDPEWQKPGNRAGLGQKVYRVSPTKAVTVVDTTVSRPNGVSLSPDGNTLYVTDDQKNVWKYKVDAAGATTKDGKLTTTEGNYPDGMTVDCSGNVYVATQAGVEVFKATGEKVGKISGFGGALNVAFGGADRKTLLITGPDTAVQSIVLNVPGLPY